MAVSQASHGCARSSWKYTHTGKRVSAGAVYVASLRSVDGDFIAGAALQLQVGTFAHIVLLMGVDGGL